MNKSGIYKTIEGQYLQNNVLCFVIDGQKNLTLSKFYTSIKRKLKFPSYFGRNLDALEECLMDLSWLNSPQVILTIMHSDDFLSDEDEQNTTNVWSIFEMATDFWKNGALELIIVKN